MVSLKEARQRAAENKVRQFEGKAPITPKSVRAQVTGSTLRAEIEAWHSEGRHIFSSEHDWRDKLRRLEIHVPSAVLDSPIDAVTPAHLLAFLTPLTMTKAETAKRVRHSLSQVFRRSRLYGKCEIDPTRDLTLALPKAKRSTPQRALHYPEVSDALREVEGSNAFAGTKQAFRYMVLCASRPGEARNAEWAEIDGGLWTISADKMKSDREHCIPLSNQAQEVLEKAKGLSWDSELIFTSPIGGHVAQSRSTMLNMLKSLGIPSTAHGFRSAFKTWATTETSASWTAIELSMAHTIGGNVERAYFRGDLLEQRKNLMQDWADYLTT